MSREKYGYAKFRDNRNPNNFEEKGVDWTTGLVGKGQRFVPYNGAIGKGQLGWLRATLVAAQGANEKCVVLSHISLVPGACSISCCIWNYEEVLEVLHNPLVVFECRGSVEVNDTLNGHGLCISNYSLAQVTNSLRSQVPAAPARPFLLWE